MLHQRVHEVASETVAGVRVARGLRLCSLNMLCRPRLPFSRSARGYFDRSLDELLAADRLPPRASLE